MNWFKRIRRAKEPIRAEDKSALKDWLYHTSDQERFMRDFNALLAGHDPYPIQINFYEDPSWQIWSEVVEAAQGKNV